MDEQLAQLLLSEKLNEASVNNYVKGYTMLSTEEFISTRSELSHQHFVSNLRQYRELHEAIQQSSDPKEGEEAALLSKSDPQEIYS